MGMGTRAGGAAIAALALLLAGCTSGPTAITRTDGTDVELTLVAFDTCADTLAALRNAAARERGRERNYSKPAQDDAARGAVPEAPVAAAPDSSAPGGSLTGAEKHSGTNNHESGVDEADLVKTDGKRIVTIVDGTLRVVDAASRRLTSTLSLTAALKDRGAYPSQLLLHGSRALVIASAGGYGYERSLLPDGALSKPVLPYPEQPGSTLLQVELDGGPRVLSSLTVDGAYVDARHVGSVARVVVRSGPRVPYAYQDGIADPAKVDQENRRRIEESTEEQWLPRYELDSGGRTEKGRVPCDHVVRPTEFSGTSMLTIYSLDLETSLTDGDPLTVVADGDTVYASEKSLYVAHQALLHVTRGRGTAEAPSCTSSTSPSPAARGTWRRERCRARCSTSTRCPSTTVTCASPPRARETRPPRARSTYWPHAGSRWTRRPASTGSARASASTPSGSPATAATW